MKMASKGNKVPPLLSKSKSYEDWVKKIKIWTKITSLPKTDLGGAVLMTLEGEAEDKILELDESDIIAENGIENILKQLDILFKKNETVEKFNALDAFETYRRPSDLGINEFVIEFDKRYNKTKKLGTAMSDDLLAYKLIKSANLSDQDEKVVKATCKLTYDDVKAKLKSIYGDASYGMEAKCDVKVEETFEAIGSDGNTALYVKSRGRGRNRGRGRGRGHKEGTSRDGNSSSTSDRKNPVDGDGNQRQCFICKSIFHFADCCPHKSTNQTNLTSDHSVEDSTSEASTLLTEHIVMYQSNYQNTSKLSELLSQTWNTAVLDCGATKTVAGSSWVDHYLDCLSDDEKRLVKSNDTKTSYRFGDGNQVLSTKNVMLPGHIGNKPVLISTDVIEKDIPLLLSRESMRKAKMKLDFSNDTVQVANETIHLDSTDSGHYVIPLTKPVKLLRRADKDDSVKFTLSVSEKDDRKIALKLHSQFAHPTSERLIKLLKNAGSKWSSNDNLKKEIRSVSESCETCLRFKKPPSRPVVGLPMATTPNECVAMDLKFYENRILLHMIDHATRWSSSCRIPSKNPKVVVKGIFTHWIQTRGAPRKFLSDNGGEFMNEEFLSLCEKMNISVKTTAAESPWSNGLVERHNAVIADMLDKVLAEGKCEFDTALAWCLSAKNSLLNNHGYSPNQLSFGYNPNFPVAIADRPTAYEPSSFDIIRENLNALHSARKAFIESESSEKIRKALAHNTRTSNGTKYLTGDSVYYKRKDSREWKGPGVVIGQDGQQILVKHGSTYVRVHPCRVMLKDTSPSLSQRTTDDGNHAEDPVMQSDGANEDVSDSVRCDDDSDTDIVDDDDNGDPIEDLDTRSVAPRVVEPCGDSPLVVASLADKRACEGSLKKKAIVQVKLPVSENWENVELTSRAGKAKGKYKLCWNTKNVDTGEEKYIDFEEVEWKPGMGLHESSSTSFDCGTDVHESVRESNEECLVSDVLKEVCDSSLIAAKKAELENWTSNGVYEEVEDTGQDSMSVRWVISSKVVDDKVVCKARLCARGFEEIQTFRTDSPTCSRESTRMLLAILACNSWTVNALDIKAAFLQGKQIDRLVFVRPPDEAMTTKLWKLKKCVYGLADAPRRWYVKLKEELERLGMSCSSYDDGLFFLHDANKKLIGVLTCHVDDILWGGTVEFENLVIAQVMQIFQISKSLSKAFTYVGVELAQQSDGSITLCQDSYARSISPIKLADLDLKDKHVKASDRLVSELRRACGQLNWLSCITRPDLAFDVSVLSSKLRDATVADIVYVNKTIRKVKNSSCRILFGKVDLKNAILRCYSDASFNILPNGGSQGGYIIFLEDSKGRCCPVEWKSNKIKRVVRSALAAESLACADVTDAGVFWAGALSEILPDTSIKKHSLTDSKSLFDNLQSRKAVSDRLLRLDVNVIKQNIKLNKFTVSWCRTQSNLSDVLTKPGVCSTPILSTLRNGKF